MAKTYEDLEIERNKKELNNINKDIYTEDDFAEALIVYINSIQNSICDFDLKITDLLENITQ